MIQEIRAQYLAQFEGTPLLIKAPGRINLIGEHTDYNDGFVMPASIDKAMYFAIGIKKGQKVTRVQALNYGELVTIEHQSELPSWARYFRAILEILKEKGYKTEGINCVFGGDIPIGAGLSSSAALCCGFIYGISLLLNLEIPRRTIALIAQEAEHRIGLNCGLMDQYAVLFGKKGEVFQLDCKKLEIRYLPMQLDDHSLVLIDSKIEHELEGSPYNERRASCELVVKTVATKYKEITSLRDLSMERLLKFEKMLDPLDFQRAKYILEENERVGRMMQALQAGKMEEVGAILLEAHQGMSKKYDISLPEIDLLVALAQKEEAILGARMMGGGFGGCTINLIENKDLEATLNRVKTQYFDRTGVQAETYLIRPSDGLKQVREA